MAETAAMRSQATASSERAARQPGSPAAERVIGMDCRVCVDGHAGVGPSRSTLAKMRRNLAPAVGLKLVFPATTPVRAAVMAGTGAMVRATVSARRRLPWRPPTA
ncbi:hypothetical protein E0493_14305 [Roseomonas sp. M0104]|uniref:Uncharacterized protein n=1 Tax=Teichococcus coralli TaxID=2545983 RepID=A0A845BEI3_9PROT|nr:hypothetical protein [Pseudoroseomonas coralli]MXP64520.1 hypothetical protein [Pseudoroseomonas coralli]